MALTISYDGTGIVAYADGQTTDTGGGTWGELGAGTVGDNPDVYLYGSNSFGSKYASKAGRTYYQDNGTINYTTNADGSCWYSLGAGAPNVSHQTPGTNFTNVNSSLGGNQWFVYCNNSIGNLNYTTVSFFIDLDNPNVTITFPQNGTNYSQSYIDLNITASDASLETYGCWYSFNDGVTKRWNFGDEIPTSLIISSIFEVDPDNIKKVTLTLPVSDVQLNTRELPLAGDVIVTVT